MEEKVNIRKVSVKEYLISGFIANSLTWIFISITSFSGESKLNFFQISVICITALLGSMFSAYILSMKKRLEDFEIGINLGLFSYILYVIFSAANGLYGKFLIDLFTLISFILGEIIGFKAARTRYRKKGGMGV